MLKHTLIIGLALAMTGCLVTVDSDSRAVHTVWDEGEVNRLQVGRSDQEWVRSSFGEPMNKISYADGTEVWKYRNRSEKDTEVGVFLLFSVDVEEERIDTLTIEFSNGVVSDYWIEENRY